jgi:hypothetical protein
LLHTAKRNNNTRAQNKKSKFRPFQHSPQRQLLRLFKKYVIYLFVQDVF